MAKFAREQKLKERRALKQEKRQAARKAKAEGAVPGPAVSEDDVTTDDVL